MAHIAWRMTLQTWRRWQSILRQLEDLDESSEAALLLHEEARSLPGFPRHYHEERDLIVPEIASTSRVQVPQGGVIDLRRRFA